MTNTCIYLTRRCPYSCSYCKLRVSNLLGPELTSTQWKEALRIVKAQIKPDFNLFLGNETWLCDDLPGIIRSVQSPYAVYTSCSPLLFTGNNIRSIFEGPNRLDNLSCGCDYPFAVARRGSTSEHRKAYNAHIAFATIRTMYPTVDCQGTITISAANVSHVMDTIEELSSMGVDVGLNFIHSDTGGFDFFPSQESITNLLLNCFDAGKHRRVLYTLRKYLLQGKHRVQNAQDTVELIDMFFSWKDVGSENTCWHCRGDPYGGPSIDADGSLRCCGYRKGELTSKLSVFDLATDKGVSDWRAAVEADCAECPGCTWSYPRLYKRCKDDPSFGKQVFVNHAQIHDGKVTRMNERDVQ